MKARNLSLAIVISVIVGLALSAVSIIYINQRTVTMYDNDPNFTTHTVKRGFPIAYISIIEGTGCNGGYEGSLRGVFVSGACGRDFGRSGFSFVLNTFIWFILACTLSILVRNRKK